MSDKLSHAEVEDVLSSIRRLVSDSKPKSPDAAEVPRPEKLVLTPSLRVTDSHNDWSEEDDTPDPLQRVSALLDETPEAAAEDAARDHLSVVAEEGETALETFESDPETVEDDYAVESADDPAEPVQDDVAVDAESVDAVQPEQSEIGEFDGATDEADTADHFADELEQSGVDGPNDDTDAPDMVPMFRHHEHASAAEDMGPVDEAGGLGAKVAALETLIQKRKDQWEPDDTGTDDYAGTDAPPMEWEDVAPEPEPESPQDVEPEPEPEPMRLEAHERSVAPPEDDDAELFAADEAVLDEEALRDLVSEIVRQELQGALGEKITRNVRKLVRREIHRVLASQDFE